ncbi:putative IQ motif, EF-hand binding protein [Helianthus annuus]|nr:putative IQ motif, EF-hand binding protein [Helianthus annuus]KAJ0866193.1 putative IQ motif, EF-hand binding protein [Helianthus annuus]
MGRSTSSCFKIISCGCINESIDQTHVSSQNKGHDKPGWGFGRKSSPSQVPSNAVVTEKISSTSSKEIPEPIIISSEPQITSNISEKTPDNIWTEEARNSITKNAAVSATATKTASEEDDVKCEPVPDEPESEYESAVFVIQAAVRRFLAERQLVKHKNVVKLQAAVRGHLVRSHAVGTLRCVQAIVKMQALVRARREKGVQNAGINATPTHVSIEKLLSNRLARQLLESTPKTKQINIKCDPSKSDSAWNWLERWMSVSAPETLQPHTPDHDQDKVVNFTESEVKMVISANNFGEATVRYEEKENLIKIEEDSNVKTHEEEPISESVVIPESETKPIPIPENPVSDTKPKPEPIPEDPESETEPKPIPENPVSETEPKPIPENPVSESKPEPEPEPISENPVSETKLEHAAKQHATDQTDPEERKNVFGSRKAINPAFIAAQSRFEELTSPKTNPLKSPNSVKQDDEPGSGSGPPADIGSDKNDAASTFSPADVGSSDLRKPDNEVVACADVGSTAPGAKLVTDAEPRDDGSRVVQNGGSECGTELSITSTLDSPDQFETENKKSEGVKVLNDVVDNENNSIDIAVPEKQVDEKLDDTDTELEPESSHHVDKSNEHEPPFQSSVSESPQSHMTNLESQGTPSSQISTTSKKTRSDKKVSSQTQTRKSWSYSKKSSPVSSSVDSGLRSSLEQLPKDPKPVKRRLATGSPKPDHSDHEPSVPGYMQATESARAKAVPTSSPRSSPDVHDKETYSKKRHSLPSAVNSRHDSPRMQRSLTQALQTTKGNGNQERKWLR